MLLAVLAAAAVSASPAGASPDPATTVSQLVVSPQKKIAVTVQVQGDDTATGQFLSVWPEAAYEARINGKVTLSCLIDIHGLAESCAVESESPPNKGFGKAALQLRTTFKLKPAMGADGPIESTQSIAIGFKAPDPQVVDDGSPSDGATADCGTLHPCHPIRIIGNPLQMRSVTMLDRPVWVQAARFADLERAYPAKGGGVEGYAVAHCPVQRSGALGVCQVLKEIPENHGFGAAAVNLGRDFKVSPDLAAQRHRDPLWVDIPVRFPAPGTPDRTITSPTWLASFDPDKAPKLFPPEAVAQGLTTGRGVARCVVSADGALTECTPEPGEPDGLGFSEAAVKFALAMRMNPWAGAGPVDGAVIHVPIRLNLKAKK